MPMLTPQALTRTVQEFLSEAAGAVVLENGAVAFDLAQSKYSISGEHNRCLLHLWVRRVLEAEVKNGTLVSGGQRSETRILCCAISLLRSSGSSWALTSIGGRE
ncbi:MAG: hypothetical protein WBV26_01235 [Candidatus Sulfotelmatobacter sp.]|jgi:hypothetical protein